VHDFYLGPASTRLLQTANPDGRRAAALRRQAAWVGRINALFVLAVLALAVLLVRGMPR
jgi:hypothetical protein